MNRNGMNEYREGQTPLSRERATVAAGPPAFLRVTVQFSRCPSDG